MSGWMRKTLKVQPTVFKVNAQRVLWQKRCDELLDWILCDECIKEKDETFQAGLGLDWFPEYCDGKCKIVKYIFQRDVTERGKKWQTMRMNFLNVCEYGLRLTSL